MGNTKHLRAWWMRRLVKCDTQPVKWHWRPNVTKEMHAWGFARRVHGAPCVGNNLVCSRPWVVGNERKFLALVLPRSFLSFALFPPQKPRVKNRLGTILQPGSQWAIGKLFGTRSMLRCSTRQSFAAKKEILRYWPLSFDELHTHAYRRLGTWCVAHTSVWRQL